MLPESSLWVTKRPTACKKLKPLLKNQRSVELLGMSKVARKEYIYQFFEDKKRALQVFNSLRSMRCFSAYAKSPRCAGPSAPVWSSRWRWVVMSH